MPRKSVVRLTDRPDMTLDVYRGRNTTTTLISRWGWNCVTTRRYRKVLSEKKCCQKLIITTELILIKLMQ